MSDDARTDAIGRVRRDLDQGFLPSMSAMRSTVAEVDRLWAELDRHRAREARLLTAGDALADRAGRAAALPTHGNDHRDSQQALKIAYSAWREAVRGDAPACDGSADCPASAHVHGCFAERPAAAPTDGRSAVGRCGAIPPPLSGLRAVAPLCELDAGHAGWHRDGSTEWGPVAPTDGQAPADEPDEFGPYLRAAMQRPEFRRALDDVQVRDELRSTAWEAFQHPTGFDDGAPENVQEAVEVAADAVIDLLVERTAAAPADDTAAPGPLRDARTGAVLDVLRKAIASTIGTTSLLPSSRAAEQLRQVAARCVDAALRPGSLPPAVQPVPAADAAVPDAPSVWDSGTAPGGYVCKTCGTPTESEPCAEHQPAATARIEHGRAPFDDLTPTSWEGVRQWPEVEFSDYREPDGDEPVRDGQDEPVECARCHHHRLAHTLPGCNAATPCSCPGFQEPPAAARPVRDGGEPG